MGRSKAENSWRKRTSKADCKEEVVITRGKLDGGVRDDIIQNFYLLITIHSNLF
jgi:hypothetical protein